MREWRQELEKVIQSFLAWRGSLYLFLFAALSFSRVKHPNPHKDYVAFPDHYFLDGFVRWDSGWYARIAERGYFIEGPQSDVVFFPLYPYLCRWLGMLLGNHFVAGLLLANVCTVLGLFYIARIARLFFDEQKTSLVTILVLVFPGSFFFSCYYTEGLFLFLSAASLYYFLAKDYRLCGVMGLFAALTRSHAQILFLAYLIQIILDLFSKRTRLSKNILWLFLIPLGLVFFMGILWLSVEDPLAFLRYQAGWDRESLFPLHTLWRTFANIDYRFPRNAQNTLNLINLMAALAFLAAGILMIRARWSAVLCAYVILGILVPLSTGTTMSMLRLSSVLFPAHVFLAHKIHGTPAERWIIYTFTFFLALFSLHFMNWNWVG